MTDVSTSRLLAKEKIDTLYANIYLRIDRRSPEPVADLFTEDGDLAFDQNRWVGRQQIDAFFTRYHELNLGNRRTTRHVTLNRSMTFLSETQCEVRCTSMVYAGFGDLPLATTAPVGIADFDDVCELCADGEWRVKRRHSISVFVLPGIFDFSKTPGEVPRDAES